MSETKFGGCPACGKASCVARACQELSPEHVAILEKRLNTHIETMVEPANPPGEGLPFGIIDPDYAKFFTIARIIAWQHGYALAMHGSFTRDLDLVLIPWAKVANDPESVVLHLASSTDTALQEKEPTEKEHGRLCWSLLFKGFTDPRWVDLSFMPHVPKSPVPVPKTDVLGDSRDFPLVPNELTALSNSPVALMTLVNWWHCREAEDGACSDVQVSYKARRDELTERAKAIVAEDPDCWPTDIAAELGFASKPKGVK